MAPRRFQSFDPDGKRRTYSRNLPHWRQAGTTYFVTLRQQDSIPKRVLAEWLDIRARWLAANGLSSVTQEEETARFMSRYDRIPIGVRRLFERKQSRFFHEQLDRCHGSCVLRREAPRRIVSESLHFFDGDRLWLGDFVVMPNHVHALMTPCQGWKLEQLLGSIKKWSARRIGEWMQEQNIEAPQGQSESTIGFWQGESYDRIVRDRVELAAFRDYIADNPDKARLASAEYTYYRADWLDEVEA